MQAIILAAGMGKRLGELTRNNTKCMVEVNGIPLIDRLLRQLANCELTRIVLVIGYKGEELRKHVGDSYRGIPIVYVENKLFDKTNNIYSLWMTRDLLVSEDTLLVESDLIFEDSIFDLVLNNPSENLAVVDRYQAWMDGTMVCLDSELNIINFVPKKMFNYQELHTYYKTVNIYKFSKEFSSKKYLPFLEAYIKAFGTNEYYEQVLRVFTMLDSCNLKALPLNGQKWYEIDDVQDLNIAEVLFAEGDMKLKMMQGRYGGYWRFPNLLDFCYLVNPYFPTPRLKEELKSNFDVLLTEYPSGMAVNSLLMGKYFGLSPELVCVGNGAAELIKSLMENLEGRLGIVLPTFEEYPNRLNQSRVEAYVADNDDFSYTAADLKAYFSDKDISTLLVINPDNPSGNFIAPSDLLELAEWTRARGIRLVVDESFVDFSEGSYGNTLLKDDILREHPNLVVVKSISKSYGVPGLRLGVLATADDTIIAPMRKDVAIWNINSFAEYYMQIFGKYEGDYHKACRQIIAERNRFYDELKKIPFLRVIPSQANYFLCEIISSYTSHELTLKLLTEHEILLKDCGKKQAFAGRSFIRIAVRDKADNDRLLKILQSY